MEVDDALLQLAGPGPETPNLDIPLLALYACAATLSAYVASKRSNAHSNRDFLNLKPRDQTWWKCFANGCYSDEEWRQHFRVTRQRTLHTVGACPY